MRLDALILLVLVPSAHWVQFHALQWPEGRLTYFYDAGSVRRHGERLAARWKIIASPKAGTTLYDIEINCGARTFTERRTVRVDAKGGMIETPPQELWIDHAIENGTSADGFSRRFCP